jgi:inosose dehydratase
MPIHTVEQSTPDANAQPLTRRQFAGVLGGAVVGLLRSRKTACAEASETAKSMTLGFSLYGMGTLKTEKALGVLADIGFDAVELCVWPDWDSSPARMSSERRHAMRKRLRDSGVRLSSLMEQLHPSPTDDQQQCQAMIDRLKAAVELGHDLSPDAPPLIETTLGGGRWDEVKTMYCDRIGRWAELGHATETTIAVKPHRGGGMSLPSEAVWLIQQLGEPVRLRMVYDYSHYDFRGVTLEKTLTTALPFTAFVAVKDAVKQDGRVRFALPGESGRIDYSKLLRMLQDGGYHGDVNCEVSGQIWKRDGYDSIAAARTCYRNMAGAFERAGVPRASNRPTS